MPVLSARQVTFLPATQHLDSTKSNCWQRRHWCV